MRSQAGVHSLELVAGLTFLVPMVLYAMDYACVLYGGMMNDNLCAAAARAAAAGPPTRLTGLGTGISTPKARAAAVIANARRPGSVVLVKQTVRIRETFIGTLPVAPFGGPVLGTITVKTRCDIYPPFSLPCVVNDVVCYTSQTCPWTWIMPAGGSGGLYGIASGTGGLQGPVNDIASPIPDSAP
jgi:hypothetical protein